MSSANVITAIRTIYRLALTGNCYQAALYDDAPGLDSYRHDMSLGTFAYRWPVILAYAIHLSTFLALTGKQCHFRRLFKGNKYPMEHNR